MNLSIRPPRDNEWRACRMLLPETFEDVCSRQYLLGIAGLRLAAATSFRRSSHAITHLRLHVVPPFRRQGAGSQLIAHLAGPLIEGTCDLTREPAAEPFCLRNGFTRIDTLTTVEAEMAGLRDYVNRLRERVALPPGVQVVPLASAPADQVARLHAEHVAHASELDPWRSRIGRSPEMSISPVVMIEGRVAGMLLGDVERSTAVVRSRVAAPGRRSGWINALLLAEALNTGWDHGARRARFWFTQANHDTRKLAARMNAEVVGVTALFRRSETS